MDEISLFPCNIETNKATNTIISLVSVGTLNKFNTIRCQKELPNEIEQPESLWLYCSCPCFMQLFSADATISLRKI